MKFRKAIIILLCAVMSLSMLACGSIDMPDGGTGVPSGIVTSGKTYTVTFNADGGTVSIPSLQIGDGKTMGTQLPKPTRAGFVFAGWFDSNNQEYTEKTKITGNVVLKAKWESSAARAEYEQKISSWAKPGHLYIHYKKFTHLASEQVTPPTGGTATGAPNYDAAINSTVYYDWGLWAWPKKNPNGRLFNAAWIDESGAVFDIDLTETYSDCGWNATKKEHQGVTNTFAGAEEIGVQIHQISTRTSGTGFWANDGGDNYLVMSKYARSTGDYHWFVNEAHVKDGSPTYADNVVYEDPYKNDPDRTLNATKLSGANFVTNSAADNSSTYPLKNVNNEFNCSNGYQIFIASFADSDGDGLGDIQGIINKLDYLASLNVDLLWLTPFQDSTDYHGYNINNYNSVDSRWGSKEKYRELISKAKEKKMKIVMDFVLNHTSLSNDWFIKSETLVKESNVTFAGKTYDEVDYRQFYSWITKAQYDNLNTTEKTHWYKDNYGYYFYSSFNSSQPELNFDYQPVRDAILDVCYEWMEAGLAGFRLDAVKHIYMCNEVKGKNSSVNYTKEFSTATVNGNNLDADYDHVADKDTRFNYDIKRNLNFYREFNYKLKSKYPQAYVVGENLDGWDQRTAPFYVGIDSQFDFALYYNIPRGILHAEGVSGEFGDGLGAIYNRYNRGQKAFSKFNSGYIGGQFTSNHDLPRARDRVNVTNVDENGDTFGSFYTNGSIDGKTHIYDKDDTLHNNITTTGTLQTNKITTTTERLKVYYAALMTLPGVTWLYYGDELGMSGLMQHTLTCKDSTLITSSTASLPHEDVIYRQPMKWNKATAAEFNEETHTSHGNAAFKIGYGEVICELVGVNATDYIPSVAECTNNDGSFKSGTLIDWVARLNKMRKDKGITGKSKVTLLSQGQNNCSYTVTGTNGSITVKFSTGSISGTAYNGLKFDGSKFHVLIS